MAGLDAALVVQYNSQFDYAYQQMFERLRGYCQVHTGITGTMDSFNVMDGSEGNEITGQRHADTVWIDPGTRRRWAVKHDYNHPVLLDWQEQLEVLIDPQQGYAMNGAMYAARTADRLIAAAVTGTVPSGVNGTTTSPFNTTAITPATAAGTLGNLVVAGGTGLTVGKVRTTRAIFQTREVGTDMKVPNAGEFVWAVNGGAMQQLMAETEAISGDYVRGRPLEDGTIIRFMGFDFVIFNELTNTTGTTYRTLAWHKMAMGFSSWLDRRLLIDTVPTKNDATGVRYHFSQGATRIQDKGVLAIDVVL